MSYNYICTHTYMYTYICMRNVTMDRILPPKPITLKKF